MTKRIKKMFHNHPSVANWSGIADHDIWKLLKLLENKPLRPREIERSGIIRFTLYLILFPRLCRVGAIIEYRDRSTMIGGRPYYVVGLTEKGRKLLKAFETIKEVVEDASVPSAEEKVK